MYFEIVSAIFDEETIPTGRGIRESTTRREAKRPEVSASPMMTDDAIRLAAKLVIDDGDLARARALLDLLETKPRSTPLLALATRKPDRKRLGPG